MADPGIPDDVFQSLAASPKNVRGDEGSVTERDGKDIIAMDRYLKGGAAAKAGPPFGIYPATIVYPDSV